MNCASFNLHVPISFLHFVTLLPQFIGFGILFLSMLQLFTFLSQLSFTCCLPFDKLGFAILIAFCPFWMPHLFTFQAFLYICKEQLFPLWCCFLLVTLQAHHQVGPS